MGRGPTTWYGWGGGQRVGPRSRGVRTHNNNILLYECVCVATATTGPSLAVVLRPVGRVEGKGGTQFGVALSGFVPNATVPRRAAAAGATTESAVKTSRTRAQTRRHNIVFYYNDVVVGRFEEIGRPPCVYAARASYYTVV